MTIRFDESLPAITNTLVQLFGEDSLARAVIVRDASGRLSVTLSCTLESDKLASVEALLVGQLGGYARPDRVISDSEAPGAALLFEQAARAPKTVVEGRTIQLLDRRIVGADWLRSPPPATKTPRAVFSSLKGGVGRSTALCVVAAHLSRRGRRVLAIDFDLEAPGIGTMLLRPDELPRFGTLDYLVENGISGIDDQFLADVSADSSLGASGGRVTVVPAVGRSTVENPRDALGKIARSYVEDLTQDGKILSLGDQLREMVERFENTKAYDVILVDARAGLHESTAAAMLGLGADVLLFGTDHPQTYLGYRLLFAHLGRFPTRLDDDWRDRFWFVHAKSSEIPQRVAAAEQSFSALYDLIDPPTVARAEPERLTAEDIDVDWSNETDEEVFESFERPPVLRVLEDSRYRDFDPVLDSALLLSDTYASTFKDLLSFADALAGLDEDSGT